MPRDSSTFIVGWCAIVVCSWLAMAQSTCAQGTVVKLLTTITNPTPTLDDWFGNSVAAVGSDRVLIGAPYDDTGAANAGAAYLFSTNGTLLTTFTNPTPVSGAQFGFSVTAVGSDRALIGAFQDNAGAAGAGAAYLFSTNGTLLTVFTNPTPATFDLFGFSVLAVGTDRVLIGAILDDTSATDAGAAYLFSIPYPPLNIARAASTVSVNWVTPETGLILQQAGLLSGSNAWSNVTESVSLNGPTNVVQQTLTATNRFYRLRRP